MYPVLFKIGSFPVRSYGIILAIGIAIAAWWASVRAPRHGIKSSDVADVSLIAVIAGVIGARAMFIAQEWSYFKEHPKELYSLQFSGLTSFGGLIFGALAVIILCRRKNIPIGKMLDVMGLPFLIAHAIGRVGCLLHGCCTGVICEGFPGVHFEGLSGLRHPAQLYDSAFCLIFLGLLLAYERKVRRTGQSFGLAMAAYGISRFIYEFWRAGTVQQVQMGQASSTRISGTWITEAQVMAGVIILAGLSYYFVASRRQVNSPDPSPSG